MKLTTMTGIIALIACLQVFRTVVKLRRHALGMRSALFWIVLWSSIGAGSLFPSTMDYFMQVAQMGDRMLFVLLLAVLVLFAMVFDLASKLEKTRRDVAKTVQAVALSRTGANSGPTVSAGGYPPQPGGESGDAICDTSSLPVPEQRES